MEEWNDGIMERWNDFTTEALRTLRWKYGNM